MHQSRHSKVTVKINLNEKTEKTHLVEKNNFENKPATSLSVSCFYKHMA